MQAFDSIYRSIIPGGLKISVFQINELSW